MEASQNDYANIPTKQIVYKGKTKEIPAYNSDAKLCENYGYDEVNLNVGCPSSKVIF